VTYQFINIPTPMLASHDGVCQSMSRLEVPVQVSSLLLLAFFVGVEASSALIAWCTEFFVEIGDEVRSGSNEMLVKALVSVGSFLTISGKRASEQHHWGSQPMEFLKNLGEC
jgi:hypothetical protein